VYNTSGAQTGEMEVPEAVFGGCPQVPVLHQVVVAGLAARRQGTAHTKTRGEVAGSNRKLWRQKGTGRARVGDRRPPHWTGGGRATGPRMRDYRQRVAKRVKQQGLRSALAAQAGAGGIVLVEPFQLAEAKTKALRAVLAALGAEGNTLLLLGERNEVISRCGRNLPGLHIAQAAEVSAYQVLRARKLVVTTDALPRLEARLS
jgi:large subunit ribosomal protein L4